MRPHPSQTFANHRSNDPVLILLSIVFFAGAAVGIAAFLANRPEWNGIAVALIGLGLLQLSIKVRQYVLVVQDRVIRLEMRLRLERVLPADLLPRIPDLSLGQMIALRFASDAELPDLTRKVLAENLQDRTAIKRLVKDWQPDHQRI